MAVVQFPIIPRLTRGVELAKQSTKVGPSADFVILPVIRIERYEPDPPRKGRKRITRRKRK